MSRAGTVLLSLGVVLFIALLGWQGFGSVATALAAAGWGLLAVAAFHLLPVVIDALAIERCFPATNAM
jgi:ABC-type proline/glycine betaine transport system permease subunit